MSGRTASLGSMGDSKPIASLANVNEIAFVEDGDPNVTPWSPPGYYKASGAFQATLTSTRLDFAADVVAEAIWDGVGSQEGEGTNAGGEARASIQFHLDEDALVQVGWSKTAGAHSGPWATFESLDLGFVWFQDENGAAVVSCGVLSISDCNDMFDVLTPSGVLPAGDYVLEVRVWAFHPFNSCAAGCRSSGGTFSFSIIPEPGTALLLGTGFFALAVMGRKPAKK